jgi:Domain of unknown function (DUF4350)
MPFGIAASDRKLLFIGGTLLVLMLVASVILAPPNEQLSSPVPSTYSGQPAGAEAAYLLLAKLHYPVKRWESPPTEMKDDARHVMLILAEPTQSPSESEQKALMEFVKRGGDVLFTGAQIGEYFPGAEVSRVRQAPDLETFSPKIPSHLARGAQRVTMRRESHWGRLDESQLALYGEYSSPVVVTWNLGNGQILWWTGSTPLTNSGITQDDNLSFFLNSVTGGSYVAPNRIYWDEYFHGQRSSLWSYVEKTSLRWSLLQFGLLAFAVLFTFSRRSGPIYTPMKASRLSPLEFVETLGGLYERAGAASSAVAISYQRVRSLLTRQLGLPATVPNAELAQAVDQRLGWKDPGLADLMRRAEASSHFEKLRPRVALEIIQNLDLFADKLNVRAQFHQEKN